MTNSELWNRYILARDALIDELWANGCSARSIVGIAGLDRAQVMQILTRGGQRAPAPARGNGQDLVPTDFMGLPDDLLRF